MAPRARAPGQPTQPIRSEGEGLRGSARVRSLVRSFTRGGCSRETILLKHPPQPGPRDHRTRFCIQCTHAQNAASPPPRTTGVRVQLSSPPHHQPPHPPKAASRPLPRPPSRVDFGGVTARPLPHPEVVPLPLAARRDPNSHTRVCAHGPDRGRVSNKDAPVRHGTPRLRGRRRGHSREGDNLRQRGLTRSAAGEGRGGGDADSKRV